MSRILRLAPFFVALAALAARAEEPVKTICTITVNSPDEKQAMAARLPKGRYNFVELVEKGRPDWMRSACQRHVQCDALVISGHFNAGETFYSDRVEVSEHLEIDELERAACSESCPGVFANLKEVYLFGCESLNPDASRYSSAYGESGRDRMRRIFANVPRIYGFSGAAPVGASAAAVLHRYFDATGGNGFATGRANPALLQAFHRNSMVQVAGVRAGEAQDDYRRQVCQFFDERQDAARKLAFVHTLLQGDVPHARQFFRRMEKVFAAATPAEIQSPAFQQALAGISADEGARGRFLAFLRNAEPGERARLIELAANLHWLGGDTLRDERIALVNDMLQRPRLAYSDVDLACTLDEGGSIAEARSRIAWPPNARERVAHAAVMACLGDSRARGVALRGLSSADETDVQAAQAYLRHHPIEGSDLRTAVSSVGDMPGSTAQVRALEALARLNINDPQAFAELARIYAAARSPDVQRAVAEVFLRGDVAALDKPRLAGVLQQHRIAVRAAPSDLIDILLRSLASAT